MCIRWDPKIHVQQEIKGIESYFTKKYISPKNIAFWISRILVLIYIHCDMTICDPFNKSCAEMID